MAKEIGNWKNATDPKRPSRSRTPQPRPLQPAHTPARKAALKQQAAGNETRIAAAMAPGETIVARIPTSGLALDSYNILLWIGLTALSLGFVALTFLADGFELVALRLVAIAGTALTLWAAWRSFTLPDRQLAVLTDRRVLLVSFAQTYSARPIDQMPPLTRWRGGLPDLAINKLLVRGTRANGSICFGRPPMEQYGKTIYPPFILFGVDRPRELAEKIKHALRIDYPITDRTQ